jgi:hypothetical protein
VLLSHFLPPQLSRNNAQFTLEQRESNFSESFEPERDMFVERSEERCVVFDDVEEKEEDSRYFHFNQKGHIRKNRSSFFTFRFTLFIIQVPFLGRNSFRISTLLSDSIRRKLAFRTPYIFRLVHPNRFFQKSFWTLFG